QASGGSPGNQAASGSADSQASGGPPGGQASSGSPGNQASGGSPHRTPRSCSSGAEARRRQAGVGEGSGPAAGGPHCAPVLGRPARSDPDRANSFFSRSYSTQSSVAEYLSDSKRERRLAERGIRCG